MTECSKCRTPGTWKTRPRTGNPARPTRTASENPTTDEQPSTPDPHGPENPTTDGQPGTPHPHGPENPTTNEQPAAHLALSPPRTDARTYNSGETRREVPSLIAHR